MAIEQDLKILTRTAGADLSTTGQYRFVEQSTSGTITVCNGAGEKTIGVLQNDPASGYAGAVAYAGITKVIAGAAVSIGADVTTDASGRAIAATTGTRIHGQAMSAAGAAGDIISVLLCPQGIAA